MNTASQKQTTPERANPAEVAASILAVITAEEAIEATERMSKVNRDAGCAIAAAWWQEVRAAIQ